MLIRVLEVVTIKMVQVGENGTERGANNAGNDS